MTAIPSAFLNRPTQPQALALPVFLAVILQAVGPVVRAAETGQSGTTWPGSELLVVAHRGSTLSAPENTLAAFHWAQQAGADMIEADLRVTRDGALVMLHDPSVNRTTNGRGQVHRLSLAEVKSLDAGWGQSVPALEETLDFIRGREMRLLLDVKDSRRIDPVELLAAIDQRRLASQIVVGTRSVSFARQLKAQRPDLSVLGFAASRDRIQAFLDLEVNAIRFRVSWTAADPALLEKVHGSGTQVWVTSGALRGADLHTLLAGGVDGVITDFPAELAGIRY